MKQIPFIDLFKSAVHVSGDKLAHPQEHFWLIYSFWYNAPILMHDRSAAISVHYICVCVCVCMYETCLRHERKSRSSAYYSWILLRKFRLQILVHCLTLVTVYFCFPIPVQKIPGHYLNNRQLSLPCISFPLICSLCILSLMIIVWDIDSVAE